MMSETPKKIGDLTALSAAAAGDRFYVDDVSESGSARDKYITVEDLFGSVPVTIVAQNGSYSDSVTVGAGAATSVTPPTRKGRIEVVGNVNIHADMVFDTIAGTRQQISVGSATETTTGALTGTTGTNGKITVSAHSDNKIYFENRLTEARTLYYTWKTRGDV